MYKYVLFILTHIIFLLLKGRPRIYDEVDMELLAWWRLEESITPSQTDTVADTQYGLTPLQHHLPIQIRISDPSIECHLVPLVEKGYIRRVEKEDVDIYTHHFVIQKPSGGKQLLGSFNETVNVCTQPVTQTLYVCINTYTHWT